MSKNKNNQKFKLKRFLKMALIAVLLTVVVTYVAFSIYAVFAYTQSPNRALGTTTPATWGLPYEEVSFASAAIDKLTIRGWFIPNPKSGRVLVLVHGQNATRVEHLDISKPLWDNGYNILLIDMRGHGLSDGDHYSLGFYEQWDIVGAANYLKSRGFNPNAIGAMGWSMGAASTIMAFSQTPDIKAIVSDSGYANLSSLDGLLYPGALLTCRWLRGFDLEQIKPEEAITKIGSRHALVIQGDQDHNVPVENAYKLKQAGGANVELWVLPGVAHVSSFYAQPEAYLQRVLAFFDRELAKTVQN
jgi:dipeptidyl aminopeptidase/acylaminoacyl peptidase